MEKEQSQAEIQTRAKRQKYAKENRIAKKISWIIIVSILTILIIIGLITFNNISYNLQPYNKDDKTQVEVVIEKGSTISSVAKQLEEMKIIRSATIFNYYIKTKELGSLQAGNYSMSPSMTLDDIINVLKNGGSDQPAVLATILVREGETIDTIAETVGKKTAITKEEFLDAVSNEDFIQQLVSKYPKLLTSMTQVTGLKYKLEGYLFPATYDYHKNDTAKTIVETMIRKTDSVLATYYDVIAKQNRTVHQVLTIASLAEKEGVTTEDRKKIVSVFNNRLAVNMPLQSDISILYALGVHKELVTYADLEVDSPYNLYKNVGYGPGPFNSPSEDAIDATLKPDTTEYLYFVADLKTGKVYYSKTLDEHNALVQKYVNNK